MPGRIRITLVESLVVLLALLVVASLLPACTSAAHDKAHRTHCANNLRQIGVASIAYMASNLGPEGRKGFMPHVNQLDTDDGPADVGTVLGLLMRVGEIDETEVYVCAASGDTVQRLGPNEQVSAFRFADSDVTTSSAFSYGWTKKARTDGNSTSSAVLSADRRTGEGGNHAGGRNVLQFDSSVSFVPEGDLDLAEINLAD